VAALLLTKNRALTPAQLQAALTSTAVDIGPGGFDDASRFGRLDAFAAMASEFGAAERVVVRARLSALRTLP